MPSCHICLKSIVIDPGRNMLKKCVHSYSAEGAPPVGLTWKQSTSSQNYQVWRTEFRLRRGLYDRPLSSPVSTDPYILQTSVCIYVGSGFPSRTNTSGLRTCWALGLGYGPLERSTTDGRISSTVVCSERPNQASARQIGSHPRAVKLCSGTRSRSYNKCPTASC